ncbi:flagellar biosynthesis protein FlhB [Paracoccus suum]|uniref:Flagellar biosynthesis protein FlhB n=1 Tax=Paracoccus suum TaxID=2259340 RepID=A0A344PI25_9RHOB|nr:flagellar type III secretion system protein FlhB [Paracoccus suum]AXC49030.1 flagellar biosynthesis protein FlhB [Paracoccus suum]
MSESEDKPFEASEQRLRQAREKGDIPRSLEVNALLAYAGLFLALIVGGPIAMRRWLAQVSHAEGIAGRTPGASFDAARDIAGTAAVATLALLALPGLFVLVGLLAQRTLLFTSSNLALKGSRINPIGNFGQKFGVKGLVTFSLSLIKVALAATGGWVLFGMLLELLSRAGFMRDSQWVLGLGLVLQYVMALAIGITAALAGADLLWKRLEHRRRLRMTRKEAEDEHKESEGDPHFKALRRQRAVDIAMSSMLADVEKADVVIVNPTHYAVALEWKRGSGRAPVCLAKGTDEIAARIRERAGKHRVPIWSDPPCARALHAAMEVGDEIPVAHFAAVAAAIRFAEAMRKKAKAGW